MFLMWFDDSKKPTAQKIAEACARYQERFRSAPNTVLCNEAERIAVTGLVVRSEGYIRRSNFWIGWEDSAGRARGLH
jgi:hypothetical protein